MVFSSYIFLFFFLPLTLALYYALPFSWRGVYLRNGFLTVASYLFYGWQEPWFVLLMMASTLVDFTAVKFMTAPGATRRVKNGALVASCISNLGMLGFFKYAMFTADGLNRITGLLGGPQEGLIPVLEITLPIGISFYTFQTMSYTIDVWRGNVRPARNLATFSCFVALFPQLIAGPIVRYVDVAEQLDSRSHTFDRFSSGVSLFILGLSKKILLANPVGLIADAVFGAASPTVATAWWGILAYHFQIYFDFCGYSDMAVGLGRMFGFEFVKNFDAPYHSVSISDFWRRWHISLSTWIRDYLYIPLGGNRSGAARTYVNLLITFFLCGLWHGAKTTFICWGLYQGAFLVFERLRGKAPVYAKLPRAVTVVITNVIVLFGWVLFRAPDLPQAARFWRSMVGFVPHDGASMLLQAEVFARHNLAAMILCAIVTWQGTQAFEWVKRPSVPKYFLLAVLFIIAVLSMFNQSFNPFLYFQF